MTQAMSTDTQKQLRQGKVQRGVRSTIRHLILIALSVVWLVPIVWLVVTSFSGYRGINFTTFFPETYTLDNYINVLFHPDSVAQFPQWFANTFIVAVFNCVISTCFVLMVAYAFSCCRFKSRRLLQNLSVTVNLFPGVLAMIAVYFVLRYLNLTNSYAGLIMVYAGSSGLGYLICKGFFDTVPVSLREAAKLDGASEARIFFQVVIPMSRPILVYTIINSFMMPWTDFVMAKMILNSGVSSDWTVAIGLYNMLSRTLVNNYFALFCAGGVLVSIPITSKASPPAPTRADRQDNTHQDACLQPNRAAGRLFCLQKPVRRGTCGRHGADGRKACSVERGIDCGNKRNETALSEFFDRCLLSVPALFRALLQLSSKKKIPAAETRPGL